MESPGRCLTTIYPESWLKASGYVVESCDAARPREAASQRGGNALHAGLSLLQINPHQIKAPCLGLRSGQLETHHLNLPFRDSCPNFVVAKVAIGDSGKPRLQAEDPPAAIGTIRRSVSEMSTQAAPLVPCVAGTEAEAPQQGDRQCPANRRNNAAQNRSPGSSG